MSFPALLKRLFTDNGAGDKLNSSLLPADLSGVPVGTIISYAGYGVPNGWLICNGATLATADYPALFNAIGYSWNGDESITTDKFKLPDLTDRFLEGTGTAYQKTSTQIADPSGTVVYSRYVSASIPAVIGRFTGLPNHSVFVGTQAFTRVAESWMSDGGYTESGGNYRAKIGSVDLNSERSNSIYSSSTTTVQPASAYVLFIIKY